MKKLALTSIAAVSLSMAGCAAQPYQGGFLFSDISAPVDVRDNAVGCDKSGSSEAINVLGLVALGDASTAAAKKQGGITKVGTVDVDFTNVLGIFSRTSTKVCGE